MRTRRYEGGRPHLSARLGGCALAALILAGCTTSRPTDQALLDSLAEMQIRMRLLQTELDSMHESLAQRDLDQTRRAATYDVLQARLEELQTRLVALPDEMAALCPQAPQGTVTAQCEGPEVQRVVVSGDKLVVGEVERVWVEPPAASLAAAIDPGADSSTLNASAVVEFERDGNKWVRFDLTIEEQTVTVERPLKRYTRGTGGNGSRHPTVELRVQLGDVRETVEFSLTENADAERAMILGRNFLTDVALVDVARKYVQPAFTPPRD